MFAERAIRSDRAPQNDARFGERGRNDRGIIGFLCKALVEKVRLRAPGLQRRLHRWRSNGEIEEPERGLIRYSPDGSASMEQDGSATAAGQAVPLSDGGFRATK